MVLGASLIVSGGGADDHLGNVSFPATQVPSTNLNNLDDYEEGTWTPSLTFATPGNLGVVYTDQVGSYTKIGRKVTVSFKIQTSSFTHTTASGELRVTGLPFTSNPTLEFIFVGGLVFTGITIANYTNYETVIEDDKDFLVVTASGSGQTRRTLDESHLPSGTNKVLISTITYFV